MADPVELTDIRTTHSKTYDLGRGVRRLDVSPTPVHYPGDDGRLADIAAVPVLKGGVLTCESAPYRFALHAGEVIGYDVSSREGGSASVRLTAVGGAGPKYSAPTVQGSTITFSDVAPDVDILIVLTPNAVKTLRVLKSAAAAREFAWDVAADEAGEARVQFTPTGRDAAGSALEMTSRRDGNTLTETWTGRVAARDPKTRVKSWSTEAVYPVRIDPTFSGSVGFDVDDGYEAAGLAVWVDYLELLGHSAGSYPFDPGWRFRNVTVPRGATVSSATLTLTVTGALGGGYGGGTLYGAAADNAALWSGTVLPSTTSKTSASTPVPRPAGTGAKVYAVTAIVQEIVNRAGWASGNAMSLFALTYETTERSTRINDFYDSPASAAALSITYTVGVSFDAASNSGYQAASSTYSWTHTCAGANRYLAVDVELLSLGGSVSGVTYGGVALSLVKAQDTVGGSGRVECWGLTAPAAGANTVAVTLTSSVVSAGEAVSYAGVDQTTPTEAAAGNAGTNGGSPADATVAVTPITDACWVHAACAAFDSSITAGQTSRNNVSGAGGSGANEDTNAPVSPPAATTMSYTDVGAVVAWAMAGYAVRPVQAAAATGRRPPSPGADAVARLFLMEDLV